MIKLVFMDMDGTLLKDNKEMPKNTKQVLKAIMDKGVVCGIATGRSLASLYRDFAGIEKELAYIAENGTIAVYEDKYLYAQEMSKEYVHKILHIVDKTDNVLPIAACVNHTYSLTCDEKIKEYLRQYYPTIETVDSLYDVKDEIVKLTLYNSDNNAEGRVALFDDLKDDINISISGVEWIDFSSKGANKGRGIKAFQEKFNISKEETMAFGDYMNDYEMLQSVGESYAMGNAYPKIKEISKHVIGTNEEEAVIQTLVKEFDVKL